MPDIIRCIWQAAFRNSCNPRIDNRETEGFHRVLVKIRAPWDMRCAYWCFTDVSKNRAASIFKIGVVS
jgi:hypothetical protein